MEGGSVGIAGKLVDEQTLSGDPLNSPATAGTPVSHYIYTEDSRGLKANATERLIRAYIDLGAEYRLKNILLFDGDNAGTFVVYHGYPGKWTELFRSGLNQTNKWDNYPVNVTSRYIRIENSTGRLKVPEILVYGNIDASHNFAPKIGFIRDALITSGSALTLNVSAIDPNGDSLTLNAINLPSFVSFTQTSATQGRFVFSAPSNSSLAGKSYKIGLEATDTLGLKTVQYFTAYIRYSASTNGVQTARLKSSTGAKLNYYEYLPGNYVSDKSIPEEQRPPLIIFLHGMGENGNLDGTTLNKVLYHGPPKLVNNGSHFPAIIISPQNPTGMMWNGKQSDPDPNDGFIPNINGLDRPEMVEVLNDFFQYLSQTYVFNPKRVYLTGLSSGGAGTWDFAKRYPQYFAAIVPICGANGNTNGDHVLANIPTWIFHSIEDWTVSSTSSIAHSNAISKAIAGKTLTGVMTAYITKYNSSNNAIAQTAILQTPQNGAPDFQWYWYDADASATSPLRFTMFPDSSHDSWSRAYNNTTLWNWLFSQSK